jgi:beta-N-acetylhexosaminidase
MVIVPNDFTALHFYRSLPSQKKAGLFVWPSLNGSALNPEEIKAIQTYAPSGFVLFRRNLTSLFQAKKLIDEVLKRTQEQRPLSVWSAEIMIDEEGGKVSRLPSPMIRGKDPADLVENVDAFVSQLLHQAFVAKGIGITGILAPVCDILTNLENPVMKGRCYGSDWETVETFALLVHQVFRNQGLKSCAKHFPGHGNTSTDSHREFAKSDVNWETLWNREWKPFQALIKAQVPYLMSAHVMIPEVDPQYPATLSRTFMTKVLREQMGFQGVVLSDDLRMQAVAHAYGMKDLPTDSDIFEQTSFSSHSKYTYLPYAAVDSLKAGCDVILSCQSIAEEEPIFNHIAHCIDTDAEFAKECETKFLRITRELQKRSA